MTQYSCIYSGCSLAKIVYLTYLSSLGFLGIASALFVRMCYPYEWYIFIARFTGRECLEEEKGINRQREGRAADFRLCGRTRDSACLASLADRGSTGKQPVY